VKKIVLLEQILTTISGNPSTIIMQFHRLLEIRYDTIYYLHWKTDRQAASLI